MDTPTAIDLSWNFDGASLGATLHWPDPVRGVVIFAHGSGSSRLSPRNRIVAQGLHPAGLGTVLLDLLTPQEAMADEQTHRWRFDIPLLGDRLTRAVDWMIQEKLAQEASPLSLGLFGASTGAAAALITAAARPNAMQAVVSRGGRPDLATEALPHVRCPTLLIVGGEDRDVLALNQQAIAAMAAPHRLAVVPGASHLFSEPGALETVTALTKEWFCAHLLTPPAESLRAPHLGSHV